MGEYHKQRRIYMLAKILVQGPANPGTAITIDLETYERPNMGIRRAGRPRRKWLEETLDDMWKDVQTRNEAMKHTKLNTTNPNHRELLREEAKDKKHSFNRTQETQNESGEDPDTEDELDAKVKQWIWELEEQEQQPEEEYEERDLQQHWEREEEDEQEMDGWAAVDWS